MKNNRQTDLVKIMAKVLDTFLNWLNHRWLLNFSMVKGMSIMLSTSILYK